MKNILHVPNYQLQLGEEIKDGVKILSDQSGIPMRAYPLWPAYLMTNEVENDCVGTISVRPGETYQLFRKK